jgi:hypothetical protein
MTPDVGVPESNQSDIDQRDEKEGKRISMPNQALCPSWSESFWRSRTLTWLGTLSSLLAGSADF